MNLMAKILPFERVVQQQISAFMHQFQNIIRVKHF